MKACMKMTVKQRERVIRILEVLKSKSCISSYRIEGEEIASVVLEWQEGGLDRVSEEVLHEVRPFGLLQADRGWLVLLLPKERRDKVGDAMFTTLQQSLQVMAKRALAGSTGRRYAASQKNKDEL